MIDHCQRSKSVRNCFFFGGIGWKSDLRGLGGANKPRLDYICKYSSMFELIVRVLNLLNQLQIQAEIKITCRITGWYFAPSSCWQTTFGEVLKPMQIRAITPRECRLFRVTVHVVYQIRYTQSGNGNWHCPDCNILSDAYTHLHIHLLYVYMQLVFHMYNYIHPPSLLDSYTQPILVYTGASCSLCQTCWKKKTFFSIIKRTFL